jgi:O-antigen/teichoic acid export membrane protein
LVGSWVILKRCLPLLPDIPHRWNRRTFGEMLGYGFNFQVATICQMLYDPVTKSLLSKFGGLEMTGLYEMASRMIMQLRSLPVAANQVLVPAIADLMEKSPEVIGRVYKDSYRLLFYVTLPIFSAAIAFAPLISQLWIGYYEPIFVLFVTVLAVGWFLNTLSSPVYFANLGTGELHWNTIGYLIMAVLNIASGWVLGSLFGGIGVVVAWVCSLVIGSLVIPVSYHYRHQIPMFELMPRENGGIGVGSAAGLSISLLLYYHMVDQLPPLVLATIVGSVFSAIMIIPVWLHPMRKRSLGWIVSERLQISKVNAEKL